MHTIVDGVPGGLMADPLRHLLTWDRAGKPPVVLFEPGRYLVSDAEIVRTVLASTTEPFEARAATLGAVSDWIPGSEKSRPVNAAIARELDTVLRSLPQERIEEELRSAMGGEDWPSAVSGLYLRLFGDRLLPDLSPSARKALHRALSFSNRRDRDKSAVLTLRRRIAHSRAEAALYRWASDRDGDAGFQKAVHDAVGSMDDVALVLHGLIGALCRATAMVLAWCVLLDSGWRTGMPVGTTLTRGESSAPVENRVREALRLWPTAWLMSRKVTSPIEVGGVALSPGERLFLCTFLLHRDPRVWNDADEYLPARWENPPEGYKAVYLPYGFGAAACVGSRFVSQATARVLECWSELPAAAIELRKENPVMGPILAPPEFRFAGAQV
ncbi:cytochrome P450 [Amycolatopsis thailandensis]|uniref:cytochrome P450 n=1 Tax=Amycolatopsis thailandensis TaxID=589330 RepID=UPI00365D90D7